MADMSELAENAAVPNDYRQLRACQRCHLVLPMKQFDREGCKNCGDIDTHRNLCVNFTGVAAIVNPNDSWVARWLGRQDCVAGCYALEVVADDLAGDDSD